MVVNLYVIASKLSPFLSLCYGASLPFRLNNSYRLQAAAKTQRARPMGGDDVEKD